MGKKKNTKSQRKVSTAGNPGQVAAAETRPLEFDPAVNCTKGTGPGQADGMTTPQSMSETIYPEIATVRAFLKILRAALRRLETPNSAAYVSDVRIIVDKAVSEFIMAMEIKEKIVRLLISLTRLDHEVVRTTLDQSLVTLSAAGGQTFEALDSLVQSMKMSDIPNSDGCVNSLRNIVQQRVHVHSDALARYEQVLSQVTIYQGDGALIADDNGMIVDIVLKAAFKRLHRQEPENCPELEVHPEPAFPTIAADDTPTDAQREAAQTETVPAVATVEGSAGMPKSSSVPIEQEPETTGAADGQDGHETPLEKQAKGQGSANVGPAPAHGNPGADDGSVPSKSEARLTPEIHDGREKEALETTGVERAQTGENRDGTDSGRVLKPEDVQSQCPVCFKRARLRACTRCRDIWYCSRQCQLADFMFHDEPCRLFRLFTPDRRLSPSSVRALYLPENLTVPKLCWMDLGDPQSMALMMGCDPEEIRQVDEDQFTNGVGVRRAGTNAVDCLCISSKSGFPRSDGSGRTPNKCLKAMLIPETGDIQSATYGNLCFIAKQPETGKYVDMTMSDIRTAINILMVGGTNDGLVDHRPQMTRCKTLAVCRCNHVTVSETQARFVLNPQLVYWPLRKGWMWNIQTDGEYPFQHNVLSLFRDTPVPLVMLEMIESPRLTNAWAFLFLLDMAFEGKEFLTLQAIRMLSETANTMGLLYYFRLDLKPLVPLHLQFLTDFVRELALYALPVVKVVLRDSGGNEWIEKDGTEAEADDSEAKADGASFQRRAVNVVFRRDLVKFLQNKAIMRSFWKWWYPTEVLYRIPFKHPIFEDDPILVQFIPINGEVASPLGDVFRHKPTAFETEQAKTGEHWVKIFEPFRKHQQQCAGVP